MSDVEVKRWENKFLEISIWMIRVGKEFYFFGKELASALGYADPRKTIRDRITEPEEKKSIEEILGPNFRAILEKSLESYEGKIPLSDFLKDYIKTKNLSPSLHSIIFVQLQKRKRQNLFKNGFSIL